MSKYDSPYEWGAEARTRLILLLVVAVAIFVVIGLIGYDRKRDAELGGEELSIEEIRQLAEDPDSYRF